MDVNIFGLPIFENNKKKSIQNSYYQLCKEDYLQIEDNNVILTKKGRHYLKNRNLRNINFDPPFKESMPKNLLIIYDIPEDKKPEREWFRRHLRKFGYIMVQRSAWIGPSPLPKDFIKYVTKIGLKSNLKTFKLAKGYKN